jgi:hypothetical protein
MSTIPINRKTLYTNGLPPTPQIRLAHVMLHSRLVHHLIDHQLCEVRYAQPGNDRPVTVTLPYAPGSERLVARLPDAEQAPWLRLFRSPYPVRVLLNSRWRSGWASLILPGQPSWPEARKVYRRCYPETSGDDRGAFLAIALAPGRLDHPVNREAGAAA